MLFNTFPFLVFFIAFFVVYHFACRRHDQKLWLIALGSVAFYATWSWKYVPFLLLTGVTDFYLAQYIAEQADPVKKRRLLVLSVTMNLVVLAAVKYTAFFFETARDLSHSLGRELTVPSWQIIVPLGISFYTFQSLSYTIDVYRGAFAPRRRIHEFIASLTFFPHLVAGPIVRSSFLLPQFETFEAPTWKMGRRGLLLIGGGLFKKTIADLLSAQIEAVFSGTAQPSMLRSWSAALAFTAQVYGDFAGYTDIATGVALLLGFKLPPNFALPYLATSPTDFWRRWHISLSTWLRDYLYQPLSFRFRRSPYLMLLVTFVLAGLWHGPRWTYVAFGLYWGVLLMLTQLGLDRLPRKTSRAVFANPLVRVVQTIGTFYLTVIGFVFFRATTFAQASAVLRSMHGAHGTGALDYAMSASLAAAIGGLAVSHYLDYLILRKPERMESPWVLWPLIALTFAFTMAFGISGHAFIYFQF